MKGFAKRLQLGAYFSVLALIALFMAQNAAQIDLQFLA